MRLSLLSALLISGTSFAATPTPPDTATFPGADELQTALGRKGTLANGVLAIAVPRPEKISMMGVDLPPSMGMATYPHDAKSAHEIIRQADEMMYMVKNTTRDNIAVAQQGVLK